MTELLRILLHDNFSNMTLNSSVMHDFVFAFYGGKVILLEWSGNFPSLWSRYCLKVFQKIASIRESMLPVAFTARSWCLPYRWQQGDAVWRLPVSFTGKVIVWRYGESIFHIFLEFKFLRNFKPNSNSANVYIFWANVLFFLSVSLLCPFNIP